MDGVVGFDRCGWGSLGGGRGLCSLGGVGRVSWVGGVVGFNEVGRVGK